MPTKKTAKPAAPPEPLPELRYLPADEAHWADLTELFGPTGACDGCWCMCLRAGHSRDRANNKRLLHERCRQAPAPGLLAYAPLDSPTADQTESAAEPGWQAVAWVAIAARAEYTRMQGSRQKVMRALDERPVWCLTCFFIRKGWRRRGLQGHLIAAAVDFARRQGATLIEAFPNETPAQKTSAAFIWNGTLSSFLRAGFKEVARPTLTRPVVRLELGGK